MKEGVDNAELDILWIRIEDSVIVTRMYDNGEKEPVSKFRMVKEDVELVLGFLEEDPQLARSVACNVVDVDRYVQKYQDVVCPGRQGFVFSGKCNVGCLN